MIRVVITGASGLIGWHAHALLHAANCAARFKGHAEPFDIVALDHNSFNSDPVIQKAMQGVDAVLHFAGVNRGAEAEVEVANPAIASRLVAMCKAAGVNPHIVYANSTHATLDTPYGRSKRKAAEVLGAFAPRLTNLILPHIFGETARPFYNNVTATLIRQILDGSSPTVNPEGRVQLLHAGIAAKAAIDAVLANYTGVLQPLPRHFTVPDLLAKLNGFHAQYEANIFPAFIDDFDVALFNTYRAATYPTGWPRPLRLNTDSRGTLFEAVKGGAGGQTFFSTTKPGIVRGNHFHLHKVERFLVVQGRATIRVRKVLKDEVWSYQVDGDAPTIVDMPTLHTHSIENIGSGDLLTLFWTHDQFDPANPDTYADQVLT